jgi:hypothetical protein
LGVTAVAIAPTILIVSGIIASLIATMYSLYNIIILLATDWKTIWTGIKEFIKEFIAYIKAEFADMATKLKSIISSVTTVFDPWIDKIKDAYNWVKKLVDKASELGGNLIKKISGGKAVGGGVQVGNSYMVGEKGPELFTPASNGSITPNYKMAGAGGGVNLTINMNGGTYLDDTVAERIGDKIIQVFKRTARI